MIGYFFAILAQLSYALGAVVLKKFLEKTPPLPLSLFSLGLSGAIAFGLLILVFSGIISLPTVFLTRSEIKTLLSSQNFFYLFLYSFLFVFLGEVLLTIGYIKGKSLFILSLSGLFYPLFAVFFSIFILKEGFSLKIILGATLMIIGYILILI